MSLEEVNITVWTCSNLPPSGESLKTMSEPPDELRGVRMRSFAVPTTTYHS